MLVARALMLTPRLGRGYVECEVFILFCFRDQARVSLMLTASFSTFPQLIFSPDIFPGCRASPGPSPGLAAGAGAPSLGRAS